MKEIFKERYGVDEDGDVYSLINNAGNRRTSPLLMKPHTMKSGYQSLALVIEDDSGTKRRKFCLVHRLVAETFIPNFLNKPEVNHRNGNKADNNKSNLEWVTESENAMHAFETGLRVPQPNFKLGNTNEKCCNSKPVLQLTLDGDVVQTFPSMSEAERQGFSQGNISAVIAGHRQKHKGFKWAFAV